MDDTNRNITATMDQERPSTDTVTERSEFLSSERNSYPDRLETVQEILNASPSSDLSTIGTDLLEVTSFPLNHDIIPRINRAERAFARARSSRLVATTPSNSDTSRRNLMSESVNPFMGSYGNSWVSDPDLNRERLTDSNFEYRLPYRYGNTRDLRGYETAQELSLNNVINLSTRSSGNYSSTTTSSSLSENTFDNPTFESRETQSSSQESSYQYPYRTITDDTSVDNQIEDNGLSILSSVAANIPNAPATREEPPPIESTPAEPPKELPEPQKLSVKRKRPDDPKDASSDDEDDGRVCTICLDYWTTSGKHRICALKCGHLFGYMCLERWIGSSAATSKTCPTCKAKASMKDIRFIFAKKIIATDNEKFLQLQKSLETTIEDNSRMTSELHRLNNQNRAQQIKVMQLMKTIEKMKYQNPNIYENDEKPNKTVQFEFDRSIELSKEDSCRVIVFNFDKLIVVSMKSTNPLFTGYGIRKIEIRDYLVTQFVPLHSKLIRDLAFHPQTGEWLLSASLDNTAKVLNIVNNTVVKTIQTDVPLWACCWDLDNPNLFYLGTQRGYVLQYNAQTVENDNVLHIPNDMSPVISVKSVNAKSGQVLARGAVLCCKLTSCWVFEKDGMQFTRKKLDIEGPFVNLNYNRSTRHVLVSTRPNPRWVYCRHIVFQIVEDGSDMFKVNIIHVFEGGTAQTQLSRNCQFDFGDDLLVAGYQESKRLINVWSVSTGAAVQDLKASEPIIDLCYIPPLKNLLALSEKKIRIYNIM